MMEPVGGETVSIIVESMRKRFSKNALTQIRYLNSDDPSQTMHASLKVIAPNLEIVCLDPTHLPIVFEYTSGPALPLPLPPQCVCCASVTRGSANVFTIFHTTSATGTAARPRPPSCAR
jgi:hypothetical protein